jgi:PadR family transcriptional regulator, regulatory protein PadR
MPPHTQADALRGTIDLLVLKTLLAGRTHGWGIGEAIQQVTSGVLDVNQGSLYPALQRLEHRGVIRSEWGVSDNGRRARFYSLTATGRRALRAETESWRRFAAAVETVLLHTPDAGATR